MVIKDEDLMVRVADGDLGAFEEIVRRNQQRAWRIAFRFIGDQVEAEDIVQEAFLKILASSHRYKPSASFSTYLYSVVSRLCIDHAKKKRPVLINEVPETEDPHSDPSVTMIQMERDAVVRKALDALPPRQRMVIILKYYEDLSYMDIARAMRTTVKAVERLLSRARKTLQTSLQI